jgi:hypothetical protein
VESFSRNTVKIAIDGDESKVIEFNPNDMLLRNRITEFMVSVQTKQDELVEKAKSFETDEEPVEGKLPSNIKDVLAFNQEVADYFIGELDDIFGKGASAKLFGERSFDPDLMASFMAYVMEKIGNVSNAKIEQKLGKPLKAPKAK